MPYIAEVSRRNPTCFVFLVDQSGSMAEPLAGAPGKTKAQGVADTINSLLYNLVIKTTTGTGLYNRYYVGVIGYGATTGPALPAALAGRTLIPIGDLANNPMRLDESRQLVPGQNGGTVERVVKRPIWVEPTAGGKTPMCRALGLAAEAVNGFLSLYPGCLPPTVFNITDGTASDGDPRGAATTLRGLASSDGNVLLFNIHLSAVAGQPVVYPARLPMPCSANTALLFEMSSPLPPPILATARNELPLDDGARGFAFNADLASFVRFLDIGTRADHRPRTGS